MGAVLALVAELYQMVLYPAMSYLSSQLLVAAIRPDVVAALARWQEMERQDAWERGRGRVRVACLCGSCSWRLPASWLASLPSAPPPSPGVGPAAFPGPHACATSCACSPQSLATSRRCPNRGNCESNIRWLKARFGMSVPALQWLWLPQGVSATDYSDNGTYGTLSCGLEAQAEPVAETARRAGRVADPEAPAPSLPSSQRFRCRSCQVLTHAEVGDPAAGPTRVALVCSYERLRFDSLGQVLNAPVVGAGDTHGVSPIERAMARAQAARSAQAVQASAEIPPPVPPSAEILRPPSRFHETTLQEVMLPQAQFWAREFF